MNLLLVFSKGVGIIDWEKAGFLDREIYYYTKLLRYFNNIYWLTEKKEDYKFEKKINPIMWINWDTSKSLTKNIEILPNINIVKTNQYSNIELAYNISVQVSAKFIIRQGFYHPLRYKILNKKFIKSFFLHYQERKWYKRADLIFLPLNKAKEIVSKKGVDTSKIRVIPNYINTSLFKKYNHEKVFDVIFVGRLNYIKRINWIIELRIGRAHV